MSDTSSTPVMSDTPVMPVMPIMPPNPGRPGFTQISLTPTVTKTTVQIVDSFEIEVRNVVLSTSADLTVRLFNKNTFFDIVMITLSGADYKNWGTDDSYLSSYVSAWLQANYK